MYRLKKALFFLAIYGALFGMVFFAARANGTVTSLGLYNVTTQNQCLLSWYTKKAFGCDRIFKSDFSK